MSESQGDERRRNVDEPGSLVSGPPRRQLSVGQKLAVSFLVLVVFLAFIWVGQLSRTRRAAPQPEVSIPANTSAFRPAPIVVPPAAPVQLPMPLPAPAIQRREVRREMTPAESPIFTFGGQAGASSGAPVVTSASPGLTTVPSAAGQGQGAPPANALAARLKPTVLAITKATLLPHPDMLLTQGTIIPCTLQTAIDTELAGYVKCVIPEDVRGTTGNVVLLDRGTTVVGEIQSGLMQGQDRVFVLWDRAETPEHAVITLASPGTDELGRSGLPGAVDNHFLERFGGAILLSVIQGGLQAGTALAGNSGNGSGTYFNSFQSNGEQVSNTALQATINIPPTLRKNQGDNIAIFVARDLDFSDVYSLQAAGAASGG